VGRSYDNVKDCARKKRNRENPGLASSVVVGSEMLPSIPPLRSWYSRGANTAAPVEMTEGTEGDCERHVKFAGLRRRPLQELRVRRLWECAF
jgi:hypothetical protein